MIVIRAKFRYSELGPDSECCRYDFDIICVGATIEKSIVAMPTTTSWISKCITTVFRIGPLFSKSEAGCKFERHVIIW